jgi:HK97 gp10 family phage protein
MANVIRGRESGTYFKGYIDGGPELAAKLAQLEKRVRDDLLTQVTQAGADVIADEWRAQAEARLEPGPGIGHYPDAIKVNTRPGKKGATAIIGLGDVPTEPGEAQPREYAAALEFGTSHSAAKPTLRPSFDASKNRALDAMGKKAWELIEKANG